MKKILFVCIGILLIIPILAFGFDRWLDGSWQEHECNICGKPIYVWSEEYMTPHMPSMTWDGRAYLIPPKEEANELYIDQTIRLCSDCYKKYGPIFQELTVKFISKERKENIKLIKRYKEEKRLQEIENKKRQIEALENQLKKLKKY